VMKGSCSPFEFVGQVAGASRGLEAANEENSRHGGWEKVKINTSEMKISGLWLC
jgi:hypothetical protein